MENLPFYCLSGLLLFVVSDRIHHESSCGHQIDEAKPNQTWNTVGEKNRESMQKKYGKKVALNNNI